MIKKALISVSDKNGIEEFAKELSKLGIEILSTGGTAKKLKQAGIKATDVSDYTGFPEMMEGRVKTLHPKVHGGILALRSKKEHLEQAKKHGIELIGMVVVNLYPFEDTVRKEDVKFGDVIENIDIGGPSMVRSAAKNFESVSVVVDPSDYDTIISELKEKKSVSRQTRERLALKAFQHTARYDTIISNYLNKRLQKDAFPDSLSLTFDKVSDLRYGENPHQKGALYKEPFLKETSMVSGKVLMEGKELSFNNYLDGNAALEIVKDFDEPTVAVIKHCNPCGVASRKTIEEAFRDAYDVDPMSAFGCVIAMNRQCTLKAAGLTKGKYIEVLIAPCFDDDALEFIKANKKNIRVLETGPMKRSNEGITLKKITDALLVQTREWPDIDKVKLKTVTKRKPTKEELEDLKFAWKVNKHTKSNSVVFAKDKTAYGMGVGQMSRVDASIIAKRKSDGRAEGGVMSSDAFFPFRDAVDAASEAGIKAVIHPGGSRNDEEVIKAADEHGMAMV
ncbi:bifunctional phosphoribosylaminoimidazolecarboxamide formyltransferase/IMP cyclohydrolase, partial [Candidatus Woesearchaeota archaeon]|nr:bifunctional phosphoribosylaminoimidazolecarboxamide formyltransferase/IMP cyclohydrolase [Candidatus Woesearchaeota archaeon]